MLSSTGFRLAALAGVTLLAGVVIFAFVRHDDSSKPKLPTPAPHWYHALAAPYLPSAKPKRSACNVLIGAKTMGVAHPVLPCGVKIYVQFGDTEVLTQVIDRGPNVPGREFDLTRALAAQLGITGTKLIAWRYAK